jgi:hypothetical protein
MVRQRAGSAAASFCRQGDVTDADLATVRRGWQKVLAHQPADPFGLPHVGWKGLKHDGLDVQDRRAVDRIESSYVELATCDGDEGGDRDPDPVRSARASVTEHAYFGQVMSTAGTPERTIVVAFDGSVEHVDDLDVRERGQSGQAFVAVPLIDDDGAGDVAPIVGVGWIEPSVADPPDRGDRESIAC